MNINELKKIALKNHQNEYFYHVYFVYQIAKKLQRQYGGNLQVISAAALLHDIGRDISKNPHESVGAELARRELKRLGYKTEIIGQVADCILSHNLKVEMPKTLEQKIVAVADSAAKILYASVFGLLSKKDPKDKPAWILKHIEKSYSRICAPVLSLHKSGRLDYKRKIRPEYLKIKKIYQEIINEQKKLK